MTKVIFSCFESRTNIVAPRTSKLGAKKCKQRIITNAKNGEISNRYDGMFCLRDEYTLNGINIEFIIGMYVF